jgi:hypothetical protein
MTVSINGTNGLVFNDGSTQATAASALNNRLIDAGFTINQRGYVSGTALASGVYAHDRWKAGASGATYTFTQGSLGVPITVTITAGSLQQIIEGCHVPEGGTYTLSWQGTAQARVNGGSYSASPLVVSGLTAGANVTVEFNTGTLLKPKFQTGSVADSFDYRPYGTELALCQRYYQNIMNFSGSFYSTNAVAMSCFLPVQMRTAPTVSVISGGSITINVAGTSNQTIASPSFSANSALYLSSSGGTSSTSTIGVQVNTVSGAIQATAEL